MFVKSRLFFAFSLLAASAGAASAADSQQAWSNGWYLSVGASGFSAPKFEGSSHNKLQWVPLVSIGKGPGPRFSSRNDNPSFALIDNGMFRAGIVGKFIPGRDSSDGRELKGLNKVHWGVEAGGFAEVYPTDWLRARVEVRQGFGAHSGVVADAAVDAFTDIVPDLRLSGGPRMTLASMDYFDTYYGVNARESAASGLGIYKPGGGVKSVGAGGALTWKATQNWSTSTFLEYTRLTGAAADSSLVRERGSRNQLVVGISATYKFGFQTN